MLYLNDPWLLVQEGGWPSSIESAGFRSHWSKQSSEGWGRPQAIRGISSTSSLKDGGEASKSLHQPPHPHPHLHPLPRHASPLHAQGTSAEERKEGGEEEQRVKEEVIGSDDSRPLGIWSSDIPLA